MTRSRLRLDLGDRWDAVLDPTLGRLRARLIEPPPHWLVCHVDGVHLRRDAEGALALSADRLLLSVDGGVIDDSDAVLEAVDDLLGTLAQLMDGHGRVDAAALPMPTFVWPRIRSCS